MTEKPVATSRRKRQAFNSSSTEIVADDFFDFDFNGFESNFDGNIEPALDPDFEPAIDLPTGM